MTHCDSMLQARLRELFFYQDGFLIRKKTGEKAGCPAKLNKNRRIICVDRKHYYAYRLIWLYYYGNLPEFVDHIDGDPTNDRLENLRAVTKSENNQNRDITTSVGKTGFHGIYYDKRRDKYVAEISLNNRKTHLGRFATAQEAHAAYIAAKRDMHPAWSRHVFA